MKTTTMAVRNNDGGKTKAATASFPITQNTGSIKMSSETDKGIMSQLGTGTSSIHAPNLVSPHFRVAAGVAGYGDLREERGETNCGASKHYSALGPLQKKAGLRHQLILTSTSWDSAEQFS